LLFQDCQFKSDPGHDWSDICISRPDGNDFRVLTNGQAMWFPMIHPSRILTLLGIPGPR